MKNIEENNLWVCFYEKWGEQYEKVKPFFDIITDFSNMLYDILDIEFIKSENLEVNQKNWLEHIEKLSNLEDKEFFKSYWIPVCTNKYDYFIDLSSPSFCIFKANYLSKLLWYKLEIVSSITELVISLEYGTESLENIIKKSQLENEKLVDELLSKHFKQN